MRKKFRLNKINWKKIFRRENLKKFALYGGIGFIILAIILFAWVAKDLPSARKLESRLLAQSTKIYDRNGEILYEVYGERKRTVVPLSSMSDYLKKATIAAEDKNFYRHLGLDIKGIVRATLHNLFSRNKIQGGSTLTQQFVKNALLSPERTFSRKAKEALLSLMIERIYSKDKILEFYLNEIPYGSNTYGIEAASQTYFGKKAKDLNLVESAVLAAIPKAPTYFSPYGSHKKELFFRVDYVLDQMVEQKYITSDVAEKAKKDKEKLKFQARRENIKAPHFVMYVREMLVEKYGEQVVNEGGLKVTTSLDLGHQKIAETTLQEGVKRLRYQKVANGALVSIDPKTGEILAMVGSHDYFDTKNDGNVNVATSERQPGSYFKPFAYSTAFMKGYSPATLLLDLRTDFGGGYKPRNYDSRTRGITNARNALAQSLNIPSVKMLYMAGVKDTIATAHKMGITTLQRNPDFYGLPLVLGGGEVKLLDMVSAYGVFSQNGIRHELHPILKVENSKGKVLEEYNKSKNSGKEIIPPQIAYQITNILSDNTARTPIFGYYSPLRLQGREAAAKTGTTQEYRDSWTIGYTPSLVAGVWLGNNDNSPMYRIAGSIGAAPIWNEYMTKALSGTPKENFKQPSGIKKITVCKISGLKPTPSCPKKTEIFAENYNTPDIYAKKYNLGSDTCNVHLASVKICTLSEHLATELCPEETVVERSYKQLHSELLPSDPAYSRWEAPVAAYAKANGYNKYPPTQKCGIHTGTNLPTVQITNPSSGETIKGTVDIQTSASAANGILKVNFYFDNNLIFSDSTSPYETSYNVSDKSPGEHVIKAKVYDNIYQSSENSIVVNVAQYDITLNLTKTGNNFKASASGTETYLINYVMIGINSLPQVIMSGSNPNWSYFYTSSYTQAQAFGYNSSDQRIASSNKLP